MDDAMETETQIPATYRDGLIYRDTVYNDYSVVEDYDAYELEAPETGYYYAEIDARVQKSFPQKFSKGKYIKKHNKKELY